MKFALCNELFCERLVRERLYDATCLILTDRHNGVNGQYSEPNKEVNFRTFATSLSCWTRFVVFCLAYLPGITETSFEK